MNTINKTAAKIALDIARNMERSGYDPTDDLVTALQIEITNCLNCDLEEGQGMADSSIHDMLSALESAVSRIRDDLA